MRERGACLALVLRCCVSADEGLRSKAIRLVVNQLHPLPGAKAAVEQFADHWLQAALRVGPQPQPEAEAAAAAEEDAEGAEACGGDALPSAPPLSEAAQTEEAARCVSLGFALCTRVPGLLLSRLFVAYAACAPPARAAFHRNMAGLARTLGPAPLAAVVEAPPAGAEALALHALQALCDGPDAAQLAAQLLPLARLAHSRTGDVRFMLPCLGAVGRDDARALLPALVALPGDALAPALRSLSAGPGAALSPAEVLVALHGLEATRDGPVTLRRLVDATAACFSPALRDLFNHDQLGRALQQLAEQRPLPLLFMRTVIQASRAARAVLAALQSVCLSRPRSPRRWAPRPSCTVLCWSCSRSWC